MVRYFLNVISDHTKKQSYDLRSLPVVWAAFSNQITRVDLRERSHLQRKKIRQSFRRKTLFWGFGVLPHQGPRCGERRSQCRLVAELWLMRHQTCFYGCFGQVRVCGIYRAIDVGTATRDRGVHDWWHCTSQEPATPQPTCVSLCYFCHFVFWATVTVTT